MRQPRYKPIVPVPSLDDEHLVGTTLELERDRPDLDLVAVRPMNAISSIRYLSSSIPVTRINHI